MRRGIIVSTRSERRIIGITISIICLILPVLIQSLFQILLQGEIGHRPFRVGILPVTGFAKSVVQHLVALLQRRLIESRFAKMAFVRLDPRVNVFVLLEMRRPFKVTVAIRAFIRLLPRVTALVPRLVRTAAKPFVAKLAFVRFLFGVTAFVLP